MGEQSCFSKELILEINLEDQIGVYQAERNSKDVLFCKKQVYLGFDTEPKFPMTVVKTANSQFSIYRRKKNCCGIFKQF